MKLVLLPGMDGTGELFDEFLPHITTVDYQVVPLPISGPQDYPSLTAIIQAELPESDFVLLAESFSGMIGAQLALNNVPNLRGIIFVGCFLSTPNKLLLNFARYLPFHTAFKLPFHAFFLRRLMLGKDAGSSLIDKFQKILNSVPNAALRARIRTMLQLKTPKQRCELPVFYLRGNDDRLVSSSRAAEFERCFQRVEYHELKGPHFLLQASPADCADRVTKILTQMTDRSSG